MSQDPYRYYSGQSGHNMKKCVSFDEVNRQQMLQKLIIHESHLRKTPPILDNYLTLNDPVSERIVSCQNITPSYYPNMTINMIGKRPMYSTRQCEYNIPDIILKNKDNLVNRNFNCLQPNWQWNCM